jgi:hypothetical protein
MGGGYVLDSFNRIVAEVVTNSVERNIVPTVLGPRHAE